MGRIFVANYSWRVVLFYKSRIVKPHTVKNVIFYKTEQGKNPAKEWLYDLRDTQGQRRILRRLLKVQVGHYGDFKTLSGQSGIKELRFDFGGGYRLYFGEDGKNLVVLLVGGNKSTQQRDIEEAGIYWKDYLSRKGEQHHDKL